MNEFQYLLGVLYIKYIPLNARSIHKRYFII